MSQFGPAFDRAQRRHDNQMPDDEPPLPAELESALSLCEPCHCGGSAIAGRLLERASDGGLRVILVCDSCEYAVGVPDGDNYRAAMEQWNQEQREAACQKHSWLRVDSPSSACKNTYRCVFCHTIMRQ